MQRRLAILVLILLASAFSAAAADRYVDVGGGIKIRCLEAGAGTQTPVVLIPGWRMTAEVWAPQIERFAKERRVLAIDPRSQGLSTITPDGNTPEQRARDLDVVLRSLSIDHFLLVGWSQGAQDVAAYVEQFGVGHVKGIVLVDSPVSSGSADVEERKGFVRKILEGSGIYMEHPREYTVGMIHAIFTKPVPQADLALWTERAMRTPVDTGVAMMMADMFQRDRRPTLAKFSVPTLIVASAESPSLNAQREMLKTLPHGAFVVVDDAGHAVFYDQPDKFNTLLADFLAKAARVDRRWQN